MPDQDKKDYGKTFFQWRFPEFENHERSASWWTWATIIVIGLLIYSFAANNVLFALFIVLSALTVILFRRNNQEIEIKIAEDGVVVKEKFYAYKEIKDFYIIYNPPEVKTLYFELKGFFSPRIPVHLADQNPVKIREVLLRYLSEDLTREDEPTSDQFGRMLKL